MRAVLLHNTAGNLIKTFPWNVNSVLIAACVRGHPCLFPFYGTAIPNMQIFSGGVSILIDPFFEGNPLAPDWRSVPRPDVVLVTHDHGDHLGQAVEIARETGAGAGRHC